MRKASIWINPVKGIPGRACWFVMAERFTEQGLSVNKAGPMLYNQALRLEAQLLDLPITIDPVVRLTNRQIYHVMND